MGAGSGEEAETRSPSPLEGLDHLVLAAPDLEAGIGRVQELLGVRATPGGRHSGEGTRNALICLGPARYLEILAPDPEQLTPANPRWFRVDAVKAPRLVAWAARRPDLEGLAARARRAGIPLGKVESGSRSRPDGTALAWRFTDPHAVVGDGVVPFFIDWGDSPHPSEAAAPGASLVALRAEHPDPQAVLGALQVLGVDLPVAGGPAPALIARIRGAGGIVELR